MTSSNSENLSSEVTNPQDGVDQLGGTSAPVVGACLKGTVRRIYPDNVSIDLKGGLRGRLPRVHFLSSSVAPDPALQFAVGDEIDVVVVKTHPTQTGRIVVILRLADKPKPSSKGNDLVLGERFSGTVRKLLPDTVLVEFADGLIGRLHRSKISWFDRKPDLADFFAPGDRVEVLVTDVTQKPDGRVYIKLSHRETRPFRPQDLSDRFPFGTVHPAIVSEFLPFGAFVRLDRECVALLHDSEVSWTDRRATAKAHFQLGQSVSVVIEGLNEQKGHLYVSFRQGNERGLGRTFSAGTRTVGVVVKINSYALIVQVEPDSFGILRFADIPEEARDLYEIGDRVSVLVGHEFDDLSQLRLLLDFTTLGEEWRRLTALEPPDPTAPSALRRTFFEGVKRATTINYYERSPKARAICLQHFGYNCVICGFSFEERFGEIGVGFIHVHHTRPLSEAEAAYELDPICDLRPVCPNCHAMVHKRIPAFTIDEVRALLKSKQ